jgi:hypothetical protein
MSSDLGLPRDRVGNHPRSSSAERWSGSGCACRRTAAMGPAPPRVATGCARCLPAASPLRRWIMLAYGRGYQLVANFGAGIGFAGLLAARRPPTCWCDLVAFIFGSPYGLRSRATGVSGRIADVVQGLPCCPCCSRPPPLYPGAPPLRRYHRPHVMGVSCTARRDRPNEAPPHGVAPSRCCSPRRASSWLRGGHDQHLARRDDARQRSRRGGQDITGSVGWPCCSGWSPACWSRSYRPT